MLALAVLALEMSVHVDRMPALLTLKSDRHRCFTCDEKPDALLDQKNGLEAGRGDGANLTIRLMSGGRNQNLKILDVNASGLLKWTPDRRLTRGYTRQGVFTEDQHAMHERSFRCLLPFLIP